MRLNLPAAVLLFAISVYRAAIQAFTIDEAFTYVVYVQHGWQGIFHGPFDANNHILYSILEKVARQWFGMSELSLRLPVLCGAALFFWSVARLCTLLVPGVWFSLVAFLVIAGNPVTLDFMVAARGYGLALGLLAFAMLQWIEWLEDSRPRRVWIASIALGLSVAANLIFAFAVIATFSVAVLYLLRHRKFRHIPVAVIPAVAIPLALWWLPFQAYDPKVFYFGEPTISEAVETFASSTFVHDYQRGDPFGNWYMLLYLRSYILPVLVPLLWLGLVFWLRRKTTQGLAFATLVFGVTCFGNWLAHVWLGVLYPEERTGLSLIFLFFLCWTAAIGVCWQAGRMWRWALAFPNLLLALVFLMQFAGQFDPRYFGPWRINWKIDEAMSRLKQGHGKVRTHWIYQSSAEYYRLRWKLPYEEIKREPDKFDLNDAGYFILALPTDEDVAATGLRALYRDEVTGTTLLAKE